VLFYGCDLAVAHDIIERLRRATTQLDSADGRPISISAGLVSVEAGIRFEDAYVLADQALYAAKAAGRNTVRVRGEHECQPAVPPLPSA